MTSESNWLPTADDLAGEPDGLAGIPSLFAFEVRQAFSALALDLGCTSAEVYWRAGPPGNTRWFAGSSDTPTVEPRLANEFFECPPGKRLQLQLAGRRYDAGL